MEKKKGRTLNPATEHKDDHAGDSGSWEEGSEAHACGGESPEVDVWMDTKGMFSWAESWENSPRASLTASVLHYTLTKSNVDPWFLSAILYNTVPSWKYGMSVSF